jgi:hypothetical protein
MPEYAELCHLILQVIGSRGGLARANRDGFKAGFTSRGCFSNRGIQPACTMLLEAVDVAAVKAIPKGARTA